MKIPGLPKDSRARSFVLVVVAIVVVILAFLFVTSGSDDTENNSNVGKVPGSIKNVPGGKLSPEYYQAITRANQQNAKEAEMNNQSSMSTLVNTSNDTAGGSACTAQCCKCEDANVATTLKKLVEEGKMSPQTAASLEQAAQNNLPIGQYSDMLDKLVKSGKLTPEQARKLLAEYGRQHANQTAAQGAKLMDQMIKSGQLPVSAANDLLALQKKGVSPADYKAELAKLVREGKISPEAAQRLMDQYNAQHQAQMDQQAAAQLGALENSGVVPPDAAKQLLGLQNKHVPVADYAAQLQRLVREGKISPETARKLLQQYEAAHGGAVSGSSYAGLKQAAKHQLQALVSSGRLDHNAAENLARMQDDNVPVSSYADALKRMVASGEISPQDAAKLLASYKKLHGASGADQAAKQLRKKLNSDIQGMVASGELSSGDAQRLQALADQNVSPESYAEALHRLVAEGKLSPEQAKKLLAQYDAAHNAGTLDNSAAAMKQAGLKHLAQLVAAGQLKPDAAKSLAVLQKANAPISDYAKELQKLVKEGKISPALASQLLNQYRRQHNAVEAAQLSDANALNGSGVFGSMADLGMPGALGQIPSAAGFTGSSNNVPSATSLSAADLPAAGNGFSGLQARMAAASSQQDLSQSQQQALKARQTAIAQQQAAYKAQITALASSMKAQAGNIVKTFNAPTQQVMAAVPAVATTAVGGAGAQAAAAGGAGSQPVLIKAGDVEYAVLDTAVNSDYPQSPVMATIVQGKYKGAKLIGSLQTGAGVNADRVILSFTAMSMPSWPKSVSIQAFAINPKNARSAMATSVNHHYLLRYGALFASSFLEGYANSLTQAGTTIINNTGVSTTHPTLSSRERIWVGLGQVGQNASQAAQETFDMPPTVKVKAGIGIGILFMEDVESPSAS